MKMFYEFPATKSWLFIPSCMSGRCFRVHKWSFSVIICLVHSRSAAQIHATVTLWLKVDPPSDYITTLFYYETICIQPYLSIFLFSLMLLNSGAATASLTVCTCCSSQRVWRPIPLFSWQLRSDNLNMTKMLQSRSDCYQLRGTKFRMFVQIHTLTHRRQLWHGGS